MVPEISGPPSFKDNSSGNGSSYIGGNHTELDIVERFPEPSGTMGTIALILRPVAARNGHFGQAPEYRLKGLLKVALRRFGFRCVRIAKSTGERY